MLSKYRPFKFLAYLSIFCFISDICAQAQVYKCVGEDGKILYSNSKCPENTKEESFKPKESYTINEQVDYEPLPEDLSENQDTDEPFKNDSLDIKISQEKITLHPQELSRIHLGISFVYDYFKNVYQISPPG